MFTLKVPGPITKVQGARPNDDKDLAVVTTEGLWAYHTEKIKDLHLQILLQNFSKHKNLHVPAQCVRQFLRMFLHHSYAEKEPGSQMKDVH